ncbi:MAG: potassium transporter Kup [Elusimicrobiota bacterium]
MTNDTDRAEPRLGLLCLTALGVVFGDIGTSPLYALRECFFGSHAVPVSPSNILGVLSLITWSLILVVSVKYLVFILRADNKGEGGILALMSLVRPKQSGGALLFFGLFGAALLYGDGVITPAISVLSAVEGLDVATPLFRPYLVPITVLILTGLFFFQHRGTGKVGMAFGPIVLCWFLVMAVLGIPHILREPGVLAALSPHHAVRFFLENGRAGFLALGAVFLSLTGCEAMYADLGHFSRRPIRVSWFGLVGSALLLNYFGQGALLLQEPDAAVNPFYRLAPGWALYPLVALATSATVIASQALISGVFSLTRQAIQLGFLPRLRIAHTSAETEGQIYVPVANWLLFVGTIAIVLGFRSSSSLAAAYGVGVSLIMVITTVLAYFLFRRHWGWGLAASLAWAGVFLTIDLAFFLANLAKVAQGGWVPLLIGAGIMLLFTTWSRGQDMLRKRIQEAAVPFDAFIQDAESGPLARVPGRAVFLSGSSNQTPVALLHNIKHNRVLHQKNLVVTAMFDEVPRVHEEDRVEFIPLSRSFARLILHYGFMEDPDVFRDLSRIPAPEFSGDPYQATYFLNSDAVIPAPKGELARWRVRLFRFLFHNAVRPSEFFHLPPSRVIEIGAQIQL